MNARRPFLSPFFLLLFCGTVVAGPKVSLVRVPEGGIQPQFAQDSQGVGRLIYFKGNERAGDIFCVRVETGENRFSAPIRVNSRPGSVMAVGSIRGAQMAIGKNGRVHVVWNGAEGAEKARVGGEETTPVVYARMTDDGSAFEPERNLITWTGGLDGGSSIAADGLGNVYATWHGRAPGAAEGEAGRAVFIARSQDEGKTFAREIPAVAEPTGACGCCGMRAFAEEGGAVYILYRGAEEKVNRDQILLVSPSPGAAFQLAHRHPWAIQACPMSSAFVAATPRGALAAWETQGQIFFTESKRGTPGRILSAPGTGRRKHPAAAVNQRGEFVLAWTEGTGWAKGGSVAWQTYTAQGEPAAEHGRVEGVPVWSFAAARASADGDFILIY